MKKCNNCGTELAVDDKFCGKCGAKADAAAVIPSNPVCPNPECKAVYEEGALFCKKCGFKLGEVVAAVPNVIAPNAGFPNTSVPGASWTLTIRFSHAFGQGMSFTTGLLKYQVINAGVISNFTYGDMIQIPSLTDILELEVAVKSAIGWKKGLKMKLRPKPQGTPAIVIEQDIWSGYPTATALNVDIIEQLKSK